MPATLPPGLLAGNNLSDVESIAASVTHLGLTSLASATLGTGLTLNGETLSANVVTVAGRTGAIVLTVSDISGAAPLSSPIFTGVPTAPTALSSDNSQTLATTAYVQAVVGGIAGGLTYAGQWNASTNTPTLASSAGTKGALYIVSVSGTTTLNGISSWNVGDEAVYNGTAWQRIPNTSAVSSVFGRTGVVVLQSSDVTTALTYTPLSTSGGTMSGALTVAGITNTGSFVTGIPAPLNPSDAVPKSYADAIASISIGLTATGTNQGTALSLTSKINIVSNVSSGTGVVVSSNAVGTFCEVWNAGALDLLLYPPSGAQIGTGGTNNPVIVSAGGSTRLIMVSTTQAYAQ